MFKVVEIKHDEAEVEPTYWNIYYKDFASPYLTVWSNAISAQKICDYLNSGK